MEIQTDNYLDVAVNAAIEGGKVLKHFWGKIEEINEKSCTGDLVTEADKSSEDKIIEILNHSFPKHEILAEETGLHKSENSNFLWAVDPLDGTTNYAHQFPFFAISIALLYERKPIVGVVYNPIMDELFYASKTKGAFYFDDQTQVSQVKSLETSLLATGFAYSRRTTSDNNYVEFCHMTNLSQGVRRAGCASLDLAYVAAGRLDGFWEKDLNPWDIAAGALIVEESGGQISDYQGNPLNYLNPNKILATNGHLHSTVTLKLSQVSGKHLRFDHENIPKVHLSNA